MNFATYFGDIINPKRIGIKSIEEEVVLGLLEHRDFRRARMFLKERGFN